MSDLRKYVQGQDYFLAGSGCTLSATSITLQTMTYPDNETLVIMADFGALGYATLEPETPQEENISFTGITQNANGSATLTGVTRGLGFKSPYTADASLRIAHAGGAKIRISNSAPFYNEFANRFNDETIEEFWTFIENVTVPLVPIANADAASKQYVDNVAISGAPDANTTTKGIVQEATQVQNNAGTDTGSTGARLFAVPSKNALSVQNSTWTYAADAGGTDAYAITLTPAVTAYVNGQEFTFRANTANTGAATLAVNGLAAITLKKYANGIVSDLATGDILAATIVHVVYNGGIFQVTNTLASQLTTAASAEAQAFFDTFNGTGAQVNTVVDGPTSNADQRHTHDFAELLARKTGDGWFYVPMPIFVYNDGGGDDVLNPWLSSGDAGGSVAQTVTQLQMTTDSTDGDMWGLRATSSTPPSNGLDWDNSFDMLWQAQYSAGATCDGVMGIGEDLTGLPGANTLVNNHTLTARHAAFFVDAGVLYASNGNGTTQTVTDISSGINVALPHTYRIVYTATTNILFYVDGVLKATHTTNIPTGSTGFVPSLGVETISGGAKNMWIGNTIHLFQKTT